MRKLIILYNFSCDINKKYLAYTFLKNNLLLKQKNIVISQIDKNYYAYKNIRMILYFLKVIL